MRTLPDLEELLCSGGVVRLHTEDCVPHKQRTDTHSWEVALLCTYVCGAAPSARLLLAALVHDCPEYETGDVRAPAKRAHVELEMALLELETKWLRRIGVNWDNTLSDSEKLVLHFADKLSFVRWMRRELLAGNMLAEPFYAKGVEYTLAVLQNRAWEDHPELHQRATRLANFYIEGSNDDET